MPVEEQPVSQLNNRFSSIANDKHEHRFGSHYYQYNSGHRASTLEQLPTLLAGVGLTVFILLGMWLASKVGRLQRQRNANQANESAISANADSTAPSTSWRSSQLFALRGDADERSAGGERPARGDLIGLD